MIVFRLSRGQYAKDLSGMGAAKFGYRWNMKGTPVVYTASTRALAMAEAWGHLNFGLMPENYVMLEIEIQDSMHVEVLDESLLSENWNDFPHQKETKELGDVFFQSGRACILKVPSAVVKGDCNFLINPKHPDMKLIKIVGMMDFPFDKRMLKNQ